jgi:hypothetical protein
MIFTLCVHGNKTLRWRGGGVAVPLGIAQGSAGIGVKREREKSSRARRPGADPLTKYFTRREGEKKQLYLTHSLSQAEAEEKNHFDLADESWLLDGGGG